jgi:hypothetical protein
MALEKVPVLSNYTFSKLTRKKLISSLDREIAFYQTCITETKLAELKYLMKYNDWVEKLKEITEICEICGAEFTEENKHNVRTAAVHGINFLCRQPRVLYREIDKTIEVSSRLDEFYEFVIKIYGGNNERKETKTV